MDRDTVYAGPAAATSPSAKPTTPGSAPTSSCAVSRERRCRLRLDLPARRLPGTRRRCARHAVKRPADIAIKPLMKRYTDAPPRRLRPSTGEQRLPTRSAEAYRRRKKQRGRRQLGKKTPRRASTRSRASTRPRDRPARSSKQKPTMTTSAVHLPCAARRPLRRGVSIARRLAGIYSRVPKTPACLSARSGTAQRLADDARPAPGWGNLVYRPGARPLGPGLALGPGAPRGGSTWVPPQLTTPSRAPSWLLRALLGERAPDSELSAEGWASIRTRGGRPSARPAPSGRGRRR